MHILQINSVYEIKSTGRTMKELNNYLLANGHESTLAYSEGPSIKNGYKIGTTLEKKIHALMSRITGLQGYFSRIGTKKLINFIRKKNPDIVHIGNLHSNFINMPMLFEYLAHNNVATVITLHDCWFFTGGHTHYTVDKYYDWEQGFSKKNKDKRLMGNKSWFFDRTEKIFNDQIKWFTKIPRLAFVGVSKWVTEEARKSKVTDGAIVETIYNWIDTDTFKPVSSEQLKKKLNITNEFIILGVASGWNNKKGLNKFIELSKFIDDDTQLILVGKIDDSLILPENIISIPETDNIQELVEYYSLANVLLNLSLEETFGKIVAEALACGTPVISINSTANAELVGPGCGYVLDEWSIPDVLEKINLIKNTKADSMAENCRKYVLDNFSFQDKLSQHMQLYEKLLS